jgi:hypothetical protein
MVSNGIELLCTRYKKITSSVGPWDDRASDYSTCTTGQRPVGFSIRVQPNQESGDDTAPNAIRMRCSDETLYLVLKGLKEIGSCRKDLYGSIAHQEHLFEA